MKRASHRPAQLAETIRQVVADALLREVRDPRIGRVTVTGVHLSRDLAHARVQVVLGGGGEAAADAAQQARAMQGLASATGFLRARIARTLATRVAPELAFVMDRGLEHARRMDALLATLREGGGDAV